MPESIDLCFFSGFIWIPASSFRDCLAMSTTFLRTICLIHLGPFADKRTAKNDNEMQEREEQCQNSCDGQRQKHRKWSTPITCGMTISYNGRHESPKKMLVVNRISMKSKSLKVSRHLLNRSGFSLSNSGPENHDHWLDLDPWSEICTLSI